jgi:hypothetical protein
LVRSSGHGQNRHRLTIAALSAPTTGARREASDAVNKRRETRAAGIGDPDRKD